MFLLRFYGAMDVFVAFMLFLTPDHIAPARMLLGCGLYLFLKGYLYKGDFLSFLDSVIGGYTILAIFFPLSLLSFAGGIYLFVKGIYTLLI